MSDAVITVENLSKRYLVGHQSTQREGYTALRDVIEREVRNFARKTIDAFDFTLQSTLRQSLLGSYLGPDFVTEGCSLIL